MTEPLIRKLFACPIDGAGIERESFRRIDIEAPEHSFSREQWEVARRLVHTTADFGLLQDLSFSDDAICEGCAALRRGAPIYVDSNMICSGVSLRRLQQSCARYRAEDVHVYVADPAVAEAAQAAGLPRAVFAVRRARAYLDGAIVCFGNSPVGLLEMNRMILEEGLRPALVLAMPVGFVHVVESKAELMRLSVPQIVIRGRRGGSPLAVATLHALATLAEGRLQ
jgi:cobalt/nickel transport system ATP-binding protein/precorrin-8X/cobalt-precorrin-8 methylmutase